MGVSVLSSSVDGGVGKRGRLRSSQKMLKAGYKWIKENRQKHGDQGAVLEDFLEEVAWSGTRVVNILIVS